MRLSGLASMNWLFYKGGILLLGGSTAGLLLGEAQKI